MHARFFPRRLFRPGLMAATLGITVACSQQASSLNDGTARVERGRYLVTVGGCGDCHTPKVFTAAGPEPDTSRLLSGHPADAGLPPVPPGVIGPGQWGALANNDLTAWAGPWGISYAANLTPDMTGLGSWSPEDFIKTIRTGKHIGVGRDILPPMPWMDYAQMTDDDLRAVFAYLGSLPPVSNSVPAPVPPVTVPATAAE